MTEYEESNIQASYLEIYNEELADLLVDAGHEVFPPSTLHRTPCTLQSHPAITPYTLHTTPFIRRSLHPAR